VIIVKKVRITITDDRIEIPNTRAKLSQSGDGVEVLLTLKRSRIKDGLKVVL